MKLLTSVLLFLAAGIAQAASIPADLEFPIKNGAPDAIYRMTDHPNAVFVFEVYRLSCGDCNANASAVAKLASDYAANPRVQVLDTGTDSSDASYKEWIRRWKPKHTVIADPAKRVFNALKTESAVPQVFVVTCDGNMVGSHLDVWGTAGAAHVRELVEQGLKVTCE